MDVLEGFFRLVSLVLWCARWLLFAPFRFIRWLARERRKRKAQGSARWAHRWEQWWYGAVRGEGILLGRGAFGRLLRFSSDGMVMVFAAMGAGKGLGVVIPSLLTYRGSMVATDPKGENYAITRRQRATFGKVWMLNPTDLPHSERFNPLDMVRVGEPQEADDAEALARLMVVPDTWASHWDDKATSLIKGLILHVLHHEPPASRTLATVRRLSAEQRETFLANLTHMAGHSPSAAAREIIGAVLTSADGGASWQPQPKIEGDFYPYAALFTDAANGWVSGLAGVIKRTRDGGRTWATQANPSGVPMYALLRVADELYGLGAGGRMVRLQGDQWQAFEHGQAIPAYLSAGVALDARSMLVAGAAGALNVIHLSTQVAQAPTDTKEAR